MTQTNSAYLPGDDATLQAALQDVNTPNLLLVLATVTGDDKWLKVPYLPAPIVAPEGSLFPDDTGGFSEALVAEIHEAAIRILGEVR
ncbi:MAG: hypothetical protein ACPH3H_06790, partial [Pseudomonadales bacterium]